MTKHLLFLCIMVAVFSSVALAAPCAVGTLATYDTAGFTCTIDGLTFSNFSYSTAGSGGASAPDASGVTVTPQTGGSEVGFLFNAAWIVGPLQTEDSLILYTAACTTCQISDLFLKMIGGAGGTGVAGVAETTTTPPESLNTAVTGAGFANLTDSATFSLPVGSLDIGKDIAVSGGTAGSAHISGVFNLLSTTGGNNPPPVAEPRLILLCLALVSMMPIARRKLRKLST